MKFAWPHTRVVSQARPFTFRSAYRFQYAILWNGKGLACETNNCRKYIIYVAVPGRNQEFLSYCL